MTENEENIKTISSIHNKPNNATMLYPRAYKIIRIK